MRRRPRKHPALGLIVWFHLRETKTPIKTITMIPKTQKLRTNGFASVNSCHLLKNPRGREAEAVLQRDLKQSETKGLRVKHPYISAFSISLLLILYLFSKLFVPFFLFANIFPTMDINCIF
ncbi:hypothetical protein ISN45_Aa08g027480 [Arabidopsis thaliana x Arabidopsis arenosa]|uniref:Transmembrane protein n=1 Tax=Arabidopsis thaliana x Arabidopsis arenosa TaxID=1240361 RepID=A0A8T1XL70_9BRAS|nr:hypothetical protein ISN45_Aa08g027480 [Arabidopsis thaliana x Arabidopsis arenosa]